MNSYYTLFPIIAYICFTTRLSTVDNNTYREVNNEWKIIVDSSYNPRIILNYPDTFYVKNIYHSDSSYLDDNVYGVSLQNKRYYPIIAYKKGNPNNNIDILLPVDRCDDIIVNNIKYTNTFR